MTFLDTIFNPWLGPLLNLPAFWALLIISAFITLISTLAYKYTTNQSEMKRLKDDMKKYQKEMRETKDHAKMMKIQAKLWEINKVYMKASFKSTLYTILPIGIMFVWLSMHIAYNPILPNTDFTVTAEFAEGAQGQVSLEAIPELTGAGTREIVDIDSSKKTKPSATWTLNGDAGEYKLVVTYNTEVYNHSVLITTEKSYVTPEKPITDSKMKAIVIGNEKVKPFGPNFNIFGGYPGWFITYMVLSIVLSSLLRKVMKVY
ncbi:MAG TPA: EMC3/TMCO1 family protein [Alphaproteobacteria bacterium]|nr:EMC3/TMCO1 family protein [Alphaproteobacteria bacterium]